MRLLPRRSLLAALALTCLGFGAPPAGAQPLTPPPESVASAIDRAELLRVVEAAEAAVRTEPEMVLKLTERALAILSSQPDADLEGRVRYLRCDYFNEHDREAARREIERMRALAPQLRHGGLRAAMLGCEGEFHEHAGDNARAMALYDEAAEVAQAARDDRYLAQVLFLRGYLRGVTGDFPQGLADLKRALALYQKLELFMEARTTISGVAGMYARMGAHDEARQYYEDAVRTMPEHVPSRERIVAQYNLGRSLARLGRLDEAMGHFEQVLAHARTLKFARGEAYALRGMASVFNTRGEGARALEATRDGLQRSQALPDEPLRAQLLTQRGIALRLLKRAPEGQAALREAIRVFAAGDAVTEEGEAREELARASADAGDWREAYEQQTHSRRIMQDLLRKQVDNRFATMKAQFDTEIKERELAVLQRENLAAERTLVAQRDSARLQILAAVLASTLAALLAGIAWRQHRARHQMHALAMTDELTGLPNRRQALSAMEALLASGEKAALLILDIDHFKRINDDHGHPVGDAVLRSVGQAWAGRIPPEATLGRLGGEEFVVILRGASLDAGRTLGERLREAIAALELPVLGGAAPLTASVGVTALQTGDTVAVALARADTALYRAKEGGRNRVDAQP